MWNLGLLGAAGGVLAETGGFELLQTAILTDNATTAVDFVSNGVWADYQHLHLRASARIQAGSSTGSNLEINFNSQTSPYSNHSLRSNSSDIASGYEPGAYFNRIPFNSNSSEFGVFALDILDINDTNKNTTILSEGGMSFTYGYWVDVASGAWFNTAQVISMQVKVREQSFGSGTKLALYGLKAA